MPGLTAGRAPALIWFGAAACGAYAGVEALGLVPLLLLLALALTAALIGVLLLPNASSRPGAWLPQVAWATAIALALAAASAARYQEFLGWESEWNRGDRAILTGRVREVVPYPGNRVAVGVEANGTFGLGQGWLIRLIADPSELLAALAASEAGGLRLPVRVYPFAPAGNPGEFDRRRWALGKGYLASAYLDSPAPSLAPQREPGDAPGGERPLDLCAAWPLLTEALGHRPGITQRLAWRWRCRLLGPEPEPGQAVALAMTLGQRDRVDEGLSEHFQRAGAAHLLAVSGLHVSFLLLMVAPPFLRERGWGRGRLGWLGGLLPALAVCAFVDLTGRPASALRAGIMAVALLAAGAAGRTCSGWQRLGLAGLALLLYNPHLVFDLGFRLSFLATAGIVAVAAPCARALGRAEGRGLVRRAGAALVSSVGVSVAATWGTLPLAVTSFSVIPWLSPLVNVAAVPLGAAVLTLTLAGLILGEMWDAGGAALVGAGRWCARLLCDLVAAVPAWAAVEAAMPSPVMAAGWYLTGIGGALLLRGWSRPHRSRGLLAGRKALLVGLAFMAAASAEPVARSLLGVIDVWTLDVGQGDAVLVRGPWGKAVLIDGGGVTGRAAASGYDVGRARVVPTLRRLGVRRLAAVVSTHPDADHVQGLAAVVDERAVARAFASYATSTSASYRRFLLAVEAAGLHLEHLRAGDRFVFSRHASLRVLAGGDPAEWEGWGAAASANDRSVALVLEAHGRRFLLLGDLQTRGVRRLLAVYPDLEADGLLVPHHGARLPVLGALLDQVRPRLAAISAGAGNPYGHPAAETVEALAERQIRILRTDRHGAIRISFWPWGVRVKTVRPESWTAGRRAGAAKP